MSLGRVEWYVIFFVVSLARLRGTADMLSEVKVTKAELSLLLA
jgi:hypothetical protein